MSQFKTKMCKSCLLELSIDNFHIYRQSKDGYHRHCRLCRSEIKKQDYQKNKIQISEKRKIKRAENPGLEYSKRKEKWVKDPESKEKYLENKRKSSENYRKNNKEKSKEYTQRPEVKERTKIRNRNKMKIPQYKIAHSLRNRIRLALKNKDKKRYEKCQSTATLLGCSFVDFTQHIESLWLPGMNWENYGLYGWHIDHIIPCIQFDLSQPSEQKLCFHYSNMQPLWAKDNLEKSSKLV